MLSFEQVRTLCQSFSLEESSFKDGRLNYKYRNKIVVAYLSQTGNCYIWGRDVLNNPKFHLYKVDNNGWIKNIAFMEEQKVKELLKEVIQCRKQIELQRGKEKNKKKSA
ncbi:hypothetical protein ACFSCX_22965 [Bacillus salitolerans]|uniref:Transposase n=1 Tax=Bacillus salitolerans TaxID=1437434 RepID=A0ABW4LY45_9BACI